MVVNSAVCSPILILLQIDVNLQTLTQDTVKPSFNGLMRQFHCLLLENVLIRKDINFT